MRRLLTGICASLLATAAFATEPLAKHLGVATCASTLCHGSAKQITATSVQQNEYVTWSNFDPHAKAYSTLLGPAAQRMARRLGLASAHQAPACLACHSEVVPAARRGERFQVDDGIGCESCHGAAEKWLATHYQAPRVTHADNVAAGLAALEDPAVRAQLCTGCHLGDANRLATHQMMAAGHPRLTFELDTYTEIWRTSGGREHYVRDADYAQRKNPGAHLQVWIEGLATATRTAIDLAATRATTRAGLPEFALYNCFSCHRSMRVQGWGGGANDDLPPGTLRLADGHARALLAVAEGFGATHASALRRDLRALQLALNARPDHVAASALAAKRSVTNVRRELALLPATRNREERALNALVAAAKRGAFSDYAAAEQAAMGMVLLLAELELARADRPDIDRLFAALANDAAFDSKRFEEALSRFGARP